MVNCNPETVSTDYDTADRLYFEPLTFEDVLEVVHAEQASGTVVGVIVQLGGQTPLGLAARLTAAGVPGGRHQRRGHRPGRAPRRVRRGAAQGGPAGARVRHRGVLRRRPRDRRPDRLPGAGPPVLRARRARHGDRLRRADAGRLHRPRDHDQPGAPGAGRPVPRRRDRDRRRRPVRRRRGVHRRRDGAHRGGRRALRRLLLRAAADHPGPRRAGRGAPLHRGHRARRRRARAAQRAVRAARRDALRAGGQPAGLAHGAVRVQGHRGAAGQGGGPDHARGHHRRSCATRACCRPRGTAASCRRTRRSRSRRRCCPSTGSAPGRATGWTRCSARR